MGMGSRVLLASPGVLEPGLTLVSHRAKLEKKVTRAPR